MGDFIEVLTKLDAVAVITVLVAILFFICFIIGWTIKHRENISKWLESWFQQRTEKNKIKSMIYEDHQKIEEYRKTRLNDQEQADKIHQQLASAINAITEKLDEIQHGFVIDKIENMRWKILEFANLLINGKTCYKEQFDNILKTYDEYEKILEDNEMTNGQVEESMKFIREKYHELMNETSRS